MRQFNDVSFPPRSWDARLLAVACPTLQPVQTVHENPWFAVRNRGGYFTVEYPTTQVGILPVIEDRWVVMVRVKRPVINDMTLEFPAGATEPNESPASSAARELAEETGICVSDYSRFIPMPPLAMSSTRMPRLHYLFRINLHEEEFLERQEHDEEIFSVERIPVRDLPGKICEGSIYVALPLAVIGMYLASKVQPDLSRF